MFTVRHWVAMGVLTAMAFLLMFFVEFSLTPALPFIPPFLKYDPGDVPAILAALTMGPWAGVAVAFGKNVLFFLAGRSTFGLLGVVPNFLAGATLAAVAGWAYRQRPTPLMAAMGMGAGIMAMAGILALTNYLIFLPLLYGLPKEELAPLVLGAITPFNLIKGTMSAALAYAVAARLPAPLKESWRPERAPGRAVVRWGQKGL
ncbi:MAG TPA: ECF transporter S component [Sphingobacteriaceae bacterium]|nr:ECF transporter S component [Sphingobacteriaceae bacterium]